MKHIAGALVLLVFASLPLQAAEPALHLHLHGPASIGQDEAASGLKGIFEVPHSQTVGEFLIGSVARNVVGEFAADSSDSAVNELAAILKRGIANETVLEITDREKRAWRCTFRLPAQELEVFENVLRMFVKRHKGAIKSPIDANGGWSFTPSGSKRAVTVSRLAGWITLDATGIPQPSDWKQNGLRGLRPVPKIDGPIRLSVRSEMLPMLAPGLRLPHAFSLDLDVKYHNGRLRSDGSVRFDEDVKLALETFSPPSNSIRDPLITFSALRGFQAWLADWDYLRQWRIPVLPNQAFAWAQQDLPMHSLVAFPFPKAAQYLLKQQARVDEVLNPNLARHSMGGFEYSTNAAAQVLRGVPLMAPFATAAPEASGDWAMLGTVVGNRPTGTNTNPPPAELLAQINNRPDLLYYHWEITEPRLQQVRMIADLARIFAMQILPGNDSPFPIWLKNLASSLGNTVTEITRESDRVWKLTRTSDIGLTSLELTLLAHRLAPKVKLPSPPGVPTAK
ncbi:MAG: hypothetical protein ISQ14_06755 [Verrucomicrobiae bacterium]|nr:hypothetical protein [Verrucomicrobiae bacterium]